MRPTNKNTNTGERVPGVCCRRLLRRLFGLWRCRWTKSRTQKAPSRTAPIKRNTAHTARTSSLKARSTAVASLVYGASISETPRGPKHETCCAAASSGGIFAAAANPLNARGKKFHLRSVCSLPVAGLGKEHAPPSSRRRRNAARQVTRSCAPTPVPRNGRPRARRDPGRTGQPPARRAAVRSRRAAQECSRTACPSRSTAD